MTHDPILDEAPARLSADAARAYFDARMQGLCHEGALEIAEGVMSATGFALFETAIGACGIAWGPGGITGVQLPEKDAARTRARLTRRFAGTRESKPPLAVKRAIDGITRLLRGEPDDLATIALDMDGVPEFHRRVYEVARRIRPGSTLTYGEVAARLGDPAAARAVGQALGANPFAIIVPCHRVLAAGGRAGGFSASGGVGLKLRILAIEGASPTGTLPLPLG